MFGLLIAIAVGLAAGIEVWIEIGRAFGIDVGMSFGLAGVVESRSWSGDQIQLRQPSGFV
ncbi:hypothetical protein ACFYZ5_10365 [Streptomyces chartreusis]|uniref:hypothetical protein n=1 Tax=Streptomyces chartreusis TaxID=1969 RepID=UPI0036D1E46D